MNTKNKSESGFLKIIILIIIALALIKIVWGFDIIEFLNKPQIKNVLEAIVDFIKSIWNFFKNLFSGN